MLSRLFSVKLTRLQIMKKMETNLNDVVISVSMQASLKLRLINLCGSFKCDLKALSKCVLIAFRLCLICVYNCAQSALEIDSIYVLNASVLTKTRLATFYLWL